MMTSCMTRSRWTTTGWRTPTGWRPGSRCSSLRLSYSLMSSSSLMLSSSPHHHHHQWWWSESRQQPWRTTGEGAKWARHRRIKKEEKTKVITSVWGGKNLFNYVHTLAALPRTILKNRMNLSMSFKSSWCNSSYYSKSSKAKQPARQGIELILTSKEQRRPLHFILSLSFFFGFREPRQQRRMVTQSTTFSGRQGSVFGHFFQFLAPSSALKKFDSHWCTVDTFKYPTQNDGWWKKWVSDKDWKNVHSKPCQTWGFSLCVRGGGGGGWGLKGWIRSLAVRCSECRRIWPSKKLVLGQPRGRRCGGRTGWGGGGTLLSPSKTSTGRRGEHTKSTGRRGEHTKSTGRRGDHTKSTKEIKNV